MWNEGEQSSWSRSVDELRSSKKRSSGKEASEALMVVSTGYMTTIINAIINGEVRYFKIISNHIHS